MSYHSNLFLSFAFNACFSIFIGCGLAGFHKIFVKLIVVIVVESSMISSSMSSSNPKNFFLHYKPCLLKSLSSRKSWGIYAFSSEKFAKKYYKTQQYLLFSIILDFSKTRLKKSKKWSKMIFFQTVYKIFVISIKSYVYLQISRATIICMQIENLYLV